MDENLPDPVVGGGHSGSLPGNDAANTTASAGEIAGIGNATSGDEGPVESPRVPRKSPMKVFDDRRHEIRQRKWLKTRRGIGEKRELEFEIVLKEYFDFLDPEGTGAISVEELEEPLLQLGAVNSHSDVCALAALCDAEGTGVIEFHEFVRIVKSSDRVREVLEAMAHGDVGSRDLNFDINVAQYRRQQMMSAMTLEGADTGQVGEKEKACKLFQNWVRFLERHDKIPESTNSRSGQSLFGRLKAAAEVEASAHVAVEATRERSREMVSLRRKTARKRQIVTADLPPVAQRRQMAAFCSTHFSTMSLIFHSMIPDLNVEQNVIGRREFQTALRQLAVADVQKCPVHLTTGMISALWSMLDTAHCSVTCLSELEKGLARVAGPETLKLVQKMEEMQNEAKHDAPQEAELGEQSLDNAAFDEGAQTPSLGLGSIHSSLFSPHPDGAGTPCAEEGQVELADTLDPLNNMSALIAGGARDAQGTLRSDELNDLKLPEEEDDAPSFSRALLLAKDGLGCAKKLLKERPWHRTSFKGVDELLGSRAPAAPWLYQTSLKPPDASHFMQADFHPAEVSEEHHGHHDGDSSPVVRTSKRGQSSLGPLPEKFSHDKSIGEESTRSTVGQGVAELQAELEEPWFTSDPKAVHKNLKMPRQSPLRPGGRSSTLRNAAQNLIMTPRS